MISPNRSLKYWLITGAMMALCVPVQAAESPQVSVSQNGIAGLVLQFEGKLVSGYQSVEDDYIVLALNSFEQPRVAGTGTGGFYDGGYRPTGTFQDNWGTAEILFHCNTADVAIYQNSEKGGLSLLSAEVVATRYCPSGK